MKQYLYLFAFLFCLLSCAPDQQDVPNIDHIDLDNIMVRFDKQLMGDKTFVDMQSIENVLAKYPNFSDLYFGPVLNLRDEITTVFNVNDLQNFTSDPFVSSLQDTIDQTFGNFDIYGEVINQSLKFLKYYFPDYPTPNVYFSNTLLNFQGFVFNDHDRDGIGMGLDMFCNNLIDYKSIDPTNPAFSLYLTRTFNPDHLAKKTLDLVVRELAGNTPGIRLIDQMIHNGKKQYLLKKLLPFENDSILMEYSGKEMSWVEENELEMWSFFLDKKLFYETNQTKISKYVNPSPNAPGMPNEAPGRTANYLGWQIVNSYVKKYPKTSIQDLFAVTDAQDFLEKSSYRPKRKS